MYRPKPMCKADRVFLVALLLWSLVLSVTVFAVLFTFSTPAHAKVTKQKVGEYCFELKDKELYIVDCNNKK